MNDYDHLWSWKWWSWGIKIWLAEKTKQFYKRTFKQKPLQKIAQENLHRISIQNPTESRLQSRSLCDQTHSRSEWELVGDWNGARKAKRSQFRIPTLPRLLFHCIFAWWKKNNSVRNLVACVQITQNQCGTLLLTVVLEGNRNSFLLIAINRNRLRPRVEEVGREEVELKKPWSHRIDYGDRERNTVSNSRTQLGLGTIYIYIRKRRRWLNYLGFTPRLRMLNNWSCVLCLTRVN